jgi:hypothetical protein
MAVSWLRPALELIGPHLGSVLKAATPAFTKKSAEKELNPDALVQQQIVELQAAASRNAENIAALAAQLQNTVKALGEAAELAQERLRRAILVATLACGLSFVALCVALIGAFFQQP